MSRSDRDAAWVCGACGGEGRHLPSCSRTANAAQSDEFVPDAAAGTWEYSTEGELVAEALEASAGGRRRNLPPLGVRDRRVRVKFAWYDLWVGAYIDRAKRVLYICPLPTLLVEVRYGR